MKILFCTNAFENVTNGPAKFANHLLKINEFYRGHEIKILTEDVINEKENVYKLLLKYPKYFKFFSHLFRMFQYHKKAMDIKKTFNWDVIVYNNSFIGLVSALRLKNSIGFINDDNNATVKFGFSYSKIRYSLFKVLEKYSVEKHSMLITNSFYTRDILSKVYPLISNKCKILYKGIELNSYQRIPNFSTPTKLLFVKKDYKRGGLLYLIKAISEINLPIELNIVGPNEKELDLEFLNEINGTNQIINIKGALTQKETFKLMNSSDIFCVPSLKEALGVANIEALSYGCSVISTNVGGIPEVMDNGNCGWLVTPKSSKEIKMAILDCIYDKKQREVKRNNAFTFIEKFNIDDTIRNFVTIVENYLILNETNYTRP